MFMFEHMCLYMGYRVYGGVQVADRKIEGCQMKTRVFMNVIVHV